MPVDPTLLLDTDEHGENRAIALCGPMIERTSILAASSESFAPTAKELFDFLCENFMSGGGMHQNMSGRNLWIVQELPREFCSSSQRSFRHAKSAARVG